MGFKPRDGANEPGRSHTAAPPAKERATPALRLVSFRTCPNLQRFVVLLEEKGAPYELAYVERDQKPPWLLELSPLGRLPVVATDKGTLFEPGPIIDYLDEVTPGRLQPRDPFDRARHRSFIQLTSEMLSDLDRLIAAADESEARMAVQVLRGKLAHFEQELANGPGPYFAGEISAVDASAAPLLSRLLWIDELAPRLQLFANVPRVIGWRDALLERDSVARSLPPGTHDAFRRSLAGGAERAAGAWLEAFVDPPGVEAVPV